MAQDLRTIVAAALIEALPQPTLAVDRDGHVRLSNRAADELLNRAEGVRVEHGHLRPCCPLAAQRLALVLDSQVSGGGDGRRLMVAPQGTGGPPLLIAAAPIAFRDGLVGTSLLTIVELAETRSVAPELLQALFGLSPAEARLTARLGAAEDLASAAQRLGIRPETARSQLKTVFRKLGVRRQQDLVRLVTQIGCLCRSAAVD